VKAFEDAQAQLQEAGKGGAAPERIKELQDVVKARANDINADQHAKMFLLKSGQGSPASIRAYESYHEAIHAEVEARFHEIMEKDMGFNPQEVAPVRNATSTGRAGMDYDLALKEGRLITKDGRPSSVSEWQEAAKEAYNKAFQEKTGHSAEAAWENVTSSVHVESYKDIGNTPGKFEGWLTDLRNPENVKTLKSKFAEQATDVTRVKAWDFQNNKTMGEFSKLQEICRGTAKDMKTKLDPCSRSRRLRAPSKRRPCARPGPTGSRCRKSWRTSAATASALSRRSRNSISSPATKASTKSSTRWASPCRERCSGGGRRSAWRYPFFARHPQHALERFSKLLRCQFPFTFLISYVAARVSEWRRLHSLTLAATTQPSRSQLRGIGPIANEHPRRFPQISSQRWRKDLLVAHAHRGCDGGGSCLFRRTA